MPGLYELCCCIDRRAGHDEQTSTSDATEVPIVHARSASPIDMRMGLREPSPMPGWFAYSANTGDSNSPPEHGSCPLQSCPDGFIECCICLDYILWDDASAVADGQFDCGHSRYMHPSCLGAWAQHSAAGNGATYLSATCPMCRAQASPSQMPLGGTDYQTTETL